MIALDLFWQQANILRQFENIKHLYSTALLGIVCSKLQSYCFDLKHVQNWAKVGSIKKPPPYKFTN